MNEYMKINNIFTFDEKFRNVTGITETYNVLKNIAWEGTEKVDGTNIRIHWDGHRIEIGGRTNSATIDDLPKELRDLLTNTFLTQEMEYVFEQMFEDKDIYLFGEGYGPKIAKNGEQYSSEAKFILFDVEISGYMLNRNNVNDIAQKLGLDSVPVVFEGTLDDAINFVKQHHMSTIGGGKHEMEGLVLQPKGIVLYDNRKKPVKCKCKYRDLVKAGLVDGK